MLEGFWTDYAHLACRTARSEFNPAASALSAVLAGTRRVDHRLPDGSPGRGAAFGHVHPHVDRGAPKHAALHHEVEHLGVEADKVTESASFIDDLGADSLDTVELVMAFEEEFGCEIPDDAAETILTVGDAVKFLEKNTAA